MRRLALAVLALAAALTGLAPPAAAAEIPGGHLTPGTTVTGTISRADDQIRWTYPAVAGRSITFDVTRSSWTGGRATLSIYNASGRLESSCGVTNPNWCEIESNVTGTASLVLDPDAGVTGSATFRFAEDLPTRSLDSPHETRTASTTIGSRGQDAWFTFTAVAGGHVTFDVTQTSWTAAGQPWMTVRSPVGVESANCGVRSPRYCEFVTSRAGSYRVHVGGNGATGSLTFTFAKDKRLGALTAGVPAGADFRVRGQDAWFSFAGVAGRPVSFDFREASWGGGHAQLDFVDPFGGPRSGCTVSSPGLCRYTPASTGTWQVKLNPVLGAVGRAVFTYAPRPAGRAHRTVVHAH